MKRDLIYLTLIVSAIWAAHATAKAVQDGPQQIEPRKIEAGFTKTVHILFPSPVTGNSITDSRDSCCIISILQTRSVLRISFIPRFSYAAAPDGVVPST